MYYLSRCREHCFGMSEPYLVSRLHVLVFFFKPIILMHCKRNSVYMINLKNPNETGVIKIYSNNNLPVFPTKHSHMDRR